VVSASTEAASRDTALTTDPVLGAGPAVTTAHPFTGAELGETNANAGTMRAEYPADTANVNTKNLSGQSVQVFAGLREDPFFFDVERFFKVRSALANGTFGTRFQGTGADAGKDFTAGYNVLSLVLKVPRALLADDSGATTFVLRSQTERDRVRYLFQSPGKVVEKERVLGGTGLRYIRARLEESFPGAWSLSQNEIADGWETSIEFRRTDGAGAPEYRGGSAGVRRGAEASRAAHLVRHEPRGVSGVAPGPGQGVQGDRRASLSRDGRGRGRGIARGRRQGGNRGDCGGTSVSPFTPMSSTLSARMR
jgi:hypothetical protein